MQKKVKWDNIKLSPSKFVRTKAGLFLELDKSENGNVTTITSPFTNVPILRTPQVLTNP